MAGKFLICLALFGFVCNFAEAKPTGSQESEKVNEVELPEPAPVENSLSFEQVLEEAKQVGIEKYQDEKGIRVVIRNFDENGKLKEEEKFVETPEGGFGGIGLSSSMSTSRREDGKFVFQKNTTLVVRDLKGNVLMHEKVVYQYPRAEQHQEQN